MFDTIIEVLDGLGVTYEEDYDNGNLVIDIADVDKSTLVEVINAIMGQDYTIDDSSITVSGGETNYDETAESEGALDEAAAQYGLGDLGE